MNNTLEKRSLSDILQKYGALLTLILVVLALAIISPDFRTMDNFMKLLRQASVNGLIAFGMTAVILTGGSVHGLAADESCWQLGSLKAWGRPGLDYGALLAERAPRERGITPLYVRYNSGLRIAEIERR